MTLPASPRSVRPPVPATVKCELNWQFTTTGGRPAHNIFYIGFPPGTPTNDGTALAGVANEVFSLVTNTIQSLMHILTQYIQLVSVTVSDNGGTDTYGVSNFPPVSGGDTTDIPMPPNCCICVSWVINSRYRGGHPRTYLSGFPTNALLYPGTSQVTPIVASGIHSWATYVLANQSSIAIGADLGKIGTIRYRSGNADIPSPQFYPYVGAAVHERLDSQRRRLGKESQFPIG